MKDDDEVHRTREKRKDFEEKMQEEVPEDGDVSWRMRRRLEEARGEKTKAEDEGRKHGDRGPEHGRGVGREGRVVWTEERVRKGRMEEVGHVKRKMLWEEVSRSEVVGAQDSVG